ncbi:thiazole synthase [Paenibacillus sp. RUD330]|nr:thiazole synthase [Paenibacillus sp. RUD330]
MKAQAAAHAAAHAESRTETRTETRTEAQTEARTESQTEARTESRTEYRTEARTDGPAAVRIAGHAKPQPERGLDRDAWKVGETWLSSRFFLGTGRFPSPAVMQQALRASGAEVITFAVRRVNLEQPEDDSILQHLPEEKLIYLPNTSGAGNADEAVRIARLARAAGLGSWIKVEISADPRTLLPDPLETLKATDRLAAEGFTVLPYISDDPVLCRRLAEAGAAAVMPGGAPIGTGLGILNPYNLGLIAEESPVPVIVDAGLGSAKDAALAMELGASAVLANTPVARAADPVAMAEAMALAIRAGRLARLAGRIPALPYASASSTEAGALYPRQADRSGAWRQ